MNPALVRELFHYDPESGLFTRLKVTTNSVKVGEPAGTVERNGYRRVSIGGKHYRIHRLIWLWAYGEWPAGLIDHRDRDKANNRLSNLRVVDYSVNAENKGPQSNCSSGCPGVHFNKRAGLYQTYIGTRGRRVSLGYFKTFEMAVSARRDAEIAYRGNHE